MLEFLRAIFSTWEFRPIVLILPIVFGALYARGWLHLYRVEQARSPRPARKLPARSQSRLANPWRLISYFAGLVVLIVALLSGLDAYASLLFFVHMIQHELLLMFAPPLLWLGNPYLFVMWGLPRPLRLRMSALMASPSPFRSVLRQITSPALSLFALVAFVWIWHDGIFYNLTLTNRVVHDLEHIMFFVAGMLFWWHVMGAPPHLRRPMSYLRRTGYVLLAIPPTVALGASIAFASTPLYSYYTTVPRMWGLSPMADQMYAGAIMWESIMNYFVALLAALALHMRSEEQKTSL